MTDPNILAAAKDAISEAIQDWNTDKDWRFLQIIAPDIPITTATTRYALPSNFKKPYDAYLAGGVKLEYVEARLHDTLLPGANAIANCTAYTLYNVGTTGEIQLLPNSVNDTLTVRYYRPIIEADADGAFLDMPSRYVPGILAKARGLLCLDMKDFGGSDRWMAIAQTRLAWAKRDDDRIPDEEIRFRAATWTANLNTIDDQEWV
jgi:hypothetical protein